VRIAILIRVFSRSAGGAESYAVAIAKQLAARHEVHVFSQEYDTSVSGLHYHRVPCFGSRPRWLNQLVFAIASWWQTRHGFDVVHSHENTWHGNVQTIHVRPLRYNLLTGVDGVRRVLTWLKICFSPRLMTYVWLEQMRFSRRDKRQIVATSDLLRQECESAYPDWRSRIAVIAPGSQPPHSEMSRSEARRLLGLPSAQPLLLFVANDYKRKGLDALLTSLTRLAEEVHLAVAGKEGAAPRYKHMVRELGLSHRVHFLGLQQDMSPAYWAANCLVHPTLEDSYAMVVLEAMSHRLPVVVSGPSHCGISRELNDEHEALLLQDPHNAAELARLILCVITNDAVADRLRRKGVDFARRHSWDSRSLEYEAVFRRAVSDHPP